MIKKYKIGSEVNKLKKIENDIKNIINNKIFYICNYKITSSEISLIIKARHKSDNDIIIDVPNIMNYLLNNKKIRFNIYNWDTLEYTIELK